jgi:hypothetical protein
MRVSAFGQKLVNTRDLFAAPGLFDLSLSTVDLGIGAIGWSCRKQPI